MKTIKHNVIIKDLSGNELARFDYQQVKAICRMCDITKTVIIFDDACKIVIDWPYASVIRQIDGQIGG